MALFSIAGLLLLSVGSAAPTGNEASPIHTLDRRDICDGVGNVDPILYHDYFADTCPPINALNPDGSCSGQDGSTNDCVSYCQVKTTFTYGTEAPIENSYCHGPFTCTITDTSTVTVGATFGGSFSATIKKAFTLGISGSINFSKATAHARAFSVKLDDSQCGYFTVVPTVRTSCGSVTQGASLDGLGRLVCENQLTTGNICASQIRLHTDGSVDATTIFVKTDCVTRAPLTGDQQDSVYNQPGVPLDRGVYATLAESWQSIGVGSQGLSSSTPQCGANPPSMPVADVTTASQQLDAIGDQDCCSAADGSCTNVTQVGSHAVDLCGRNDGVQLCANCARVANYVAGLASCADSNGNVGATQDIVETPGLTVQI